MMALVAASSVYIRKNTNIYRDLRLVVDMRDMLMMVVVVVAVRHENSNTKNQCTVPGPSQNTRKAYCAGLYEGKSEYVQR